jgi:hypothetical protein
MRVAIYDLIEPSMPASLPLRLRQACSQRSTAAALALVVPAALLALAAGVALVSQTISVPQVRASLQERPTLALEILSAVAVLIFLAVLPTKRLIYRLGMTRAIEIANGVVKVTEGGHFQSWSWSAPLASYAGITHHVRASLSGTRHEIILVHPEREKSILLCVAPRTSQSEVDRVAALLGQQQIPPSELYRFKGLWPRMVTQPLPGASHA